MPNPTIIIVGRTGAFNAQGFTGPNGTGSPVNPANIASSTWALTAGEGPYAQWVSFAPSADGLSCVVSVAASAIVGIPIVIQNTIVMNDGTSAVGQDTFTTAPAPPPQIQSVVVTQTA